MNIGMGLGVGYSPRKGGGGGARIIGGAVTPGSKTVQRVDAAGASLGGSEYALGGSYYDEHGAFAFTDTIIDGQAMVRIPNFWYRRDVIVGGEHDGKEAWWVSDRALPGFVLHPAFMSAGAPVTEIWVGKYQGSNDGGTKVASVTGALPLTSINIGTFRTRCENRNVGGVTGFMMLSIYQLAAIQMLAMIEMGSTDSQAAIGNGRVSTGSAANVDAADVAQATYRGVVGLWGNIWQFLDGWRTMSGLMELWDRQGHQAWAATGLSRATSDGIGPLTMMSDVGDQWDFKDVFVPDIKATDLATSTWPDRIYLLSSGDRIPIYGDSWGSGANAGLWALYCNNGPSASHSGIGGRLAKV